jgi:uridine kinase
MEKPDNCIRIYCKNTSKYVEVPVGSALTEVYEAAGRPLAYLPMNAAVNNLTESLTYRCWQPCDVEFNDYSKLSGQRTYVRSLCHLLSKAVHDLLPSASLYLEHPISKGYYCVIRENGPLTPELIARIQARMQELIVADLPFVPHICRSSEAVELLKRNGMDDKARLLETAGLPYASYYVFDGYANYFYGGLVPSSGYLRLFGLEPYFDGLLLRVPKPDKPDELEPLVRQDKMFGVYKESLTLLRTLGLDNVGDLNQAIAGGRGAEIILVSEAMQEKQIAGIAERIAARYADGLRIVLISGPSSSGKTTFAQRLGIQLMTNLLHPVKISLDNYFLDRDKTPRDASGEYDFECLHALDLELLNNDLQTLLQGGEINLPTYDFTSGSRVYTGEKLCLRPQSILVVEGIHALNPELTAFIGEGRKYRIYVSALTAISLDNHNWIPTTDNRLLRRIVRDYRFRNYSAQQTIARWPSVRKGEDRWIFPYQETADAMFNSAMLYELAALRRFAEPLLSEVKENQPEHAEAYRLLRFLKYFNPLFDNELPATSLLCEFLGGGAFRQ